MRYEQLIIGFDAREMWLGLDTWSQETRRRFLLREDIEKPLSTDTLVWRSLFRSNIFVISGQDITTGSVLDLEFPIEQRSIDNLWKDLGAMQAYLKRTPGLEGKAYWVIAIAELMSLEDKEELKPTHPFKPLEVDPGWELLGFDVSQGNLRSGLSGEAYGDDDMEALRIRWSPHLNRYHLFSEEESADAFADWADQADAGHAPYSIYAIYRVDQQ
ncbi:MAG: hypothetical protein JNM70_18895 [Anaerolineae bacterium]|nr:hypothetical protein [Anaerolineae bacterium]